MVHKKLHTVLAISIAILSAVAACAGIFSKGGPGTYDITSVRGEKVTIYGVGIYRHMSAEVAPQGIAQDVVTLFIGIPLLLVGLWLYRQGSAKGKILFTGTLGYFLITYLFFTLMGTYSSFFLVMVVILSLSFFGFVLAYTSLDKEVLKNSFSPKFPARFAGGFLIFNAVVIALLWLSIVIPPLISGTIPKEVEHYTTLVVQALDLAILLPASFIAGLLLYRKKSYGYVLAPVYIVFLTVLMTALTAKVIAMYLLGYNVFPAIIIIPMFNTITIVCLLLVLRNVRPTADIPATV